MAVVVSFVGKWDGKDVQRGLREMQALDRQVNGSSKTFSQSFGDMAAKAAVAGAAIVGVAAVFGKAVSAASDLAESQSKASVVFADQADVVARWAKTSATAFGQTEQQALEAASTYGNLFQAFGLASDSATEMSMRMVELAADLASFNNTSIEDAIMAIRSGLSGETEPLKRFGVALTDARLKAEAMAQGIYEGSGALNAAQKAQASYALILRDTSLAQGDFARTSDGLANQQRILSAQFGNLTAQLGSILLPVVLQGVTFLNGLIKSFQGLAEWAGRNKDALVVLTVAVTAFTVALGVQRLAVMSGVAALGLYQAAVLGFVRVIDAATAANARFAASIRLIPYVAVVAAVAALVIELNRGAEAQAKWRQETALARREADSMRDSTGQLTDEARALLATNRFAHMAQKQVTEAISGTVSSAVAAGNAMKTTLTPNTYDAADAADKAAKSYLELWEAIWNTRQAASDLANTSGTVTSALAEGARTGGVQGYWQSIQQEYGATEKAARGAGKAAKEAFVSVGEALPDVVSLAREFGIQINEKSRLANSPALIDRLKESFGRVSDTIRAAKADFDNTYQSVRDTFNGFLSIATAADTFNERQRRVQETLRELNDFRASMSEEATDRELATLARLQGAYQQAQTDAANGAQSIVEEFVAQSRKFGEFGAKMQELLRLGLNKTSFMQILQMGADRGSEVADSYLKGNTRELIDQTNQTVKAYDDLARQIAQDTAATFESAGLRAAIALLKGLSVALGRDGLTRKEIKKVIADLENDLQVNIRTNMPAVNAASAPASGGGGGGGGGVQVGGQAPSSGIDWAATVPWSPDAYTSAADFNQTFDNLNAWAAGTWTPFATGGVVTAPTLGLVGEAGPEAIIPLDKLSGYGNTTNVNVTVNAGMGTDGAEVGRQIVDALKQYQRRNGPVPITVA